MFRTAALAALVLTAVYCGWVFNSLATPLLPYKHAVITVYGRAILFSAIALFFTTTAAIMLLLRVILLKDAGAKLQQAAKQFKQAQAPDPKEFEHNIIR